MTEPHAMIELRAVSKTFVHDGRDVDVLRGIDLDVARG